MNIQFKTGKIDAADFKTLRSSVKWSLPPDSAITRSIQNSEFIVTAYSGSEIAGMGRITGDGGFVYFIVDIIVKPEFQGNKIGTGIMEFIMSYLKNHAPENAYITLMAAKGKEEFYERFGFFRRPDDTYGCGMMIKL